MATKSRRVCCYKERQKRGFMKVLNGEPLKIAGKTLIQSACEYNTNNASVVNFFKNTFHDKLVL